VIGDVGDGSRPFDGRIDEVRIGDARTVDAIVVEHALAGDPAPIVVGTTEARTDVAGNPGWTVSTDAARSGSHGLVAPPDTPDAVITAAAVDAPAVEVDAWWNVDTLTGIELAQGARFAEIPRGAYETALTGAAGWDLGRLDGATRTQVTPPPGGQSPVASTWERVTLRVDQDGNAVVLHDGTQVAPASGATDLDGSLTTGSVGFRSGSLPPGQRWWIDDLRVRRFTTPEPTTDVDTLIDRP
jgi:hypothetical protein